MSEGSTMTGGTAHDATAPTPATGATAARTGRRVWWPAALGGLLALGLAVAVVLASLGGGGAPAPGEDSPEAGFARDMVIHHQQAVEMSFIVRDRTGDQDVRRLAYDIINTQANQRGMMLAWLGQWGLAKTSSEPAMAWMGGEHHHFTPHDGALMPGMATNAQLDALRAAKGKDAEVRYLQRMIAHHTSGVEMARAVVERSADEHVDLLAQTMVGGQQAEIKVMREMLAQRGAAATP